MTTEKQIISNIENAQFSTGPKTENGKAIVSVNAIRHGIFTKDLVLNSGIENEKADEYHELLENLKTSLIPANQMESLLVEKIAVDFWRLRRLIRFETGSILQEMESLLKNLYSHGKQNNEKIDREIQLKKQFIEWNLTYLECLENGIVTFDNAKWIENDIESDIIQDFYFIAKTIPNLTKLEKEMLYSYNLKFDELKNLLKKYDYSERRAISLKLIEIYTDQNQNAKDEIEDLNKQKLINVESDKLIYMLSLIPSVNNTEKILKYERSLQKSIYQNILMLKKLQGCF